MFMLEIKIIYSFSLHKILLPKNPIRTEISYPFIALGLFQFCSVRGSIITLCFGILIKILVQMQYSSNRASVFSDFTLYSHQQ